MNHEEEEERTLINYQKRSNGRISKSPEPAPVGVGDESSDDRREIGSAVEDVGHLRGRHLRHVEAGHQVDGEVGGQAHARHSLKRLVPLGLIQLTLTPIN